MVNATQNTNSAALFNSINSTNTAGGAVASATAGAQNTFLKLLVTQMRNQDPMNPMDNAQMTSQMAQLNTVNGINQLNTTLQALSNSVTSSQSLQASSLIGHGVFAPGSALNLANGTGFGGVNLSASTSDTQIAIRDQVGMTVRTLHLGAQAAGVHGWQWDGKNDAGVAVADGAYTFAVSATQGSQSVTATALAYGMVNGVTLNGTSTNLNVGQNGSVALSQVQQII